MERTLSRSHDDTKQYAKQMLRLLLQKKDKERATVIGLSGELGAGKTTLISILTSLLAPTSGTAAILGHDILSDSLNARMKVGAVPQEIISHGFFTVNQVLNFHSGYYGIKNNQERIDYLLEKLEHQPFDFNDNYLLFKELT